MKLTLNQERYLLAEQFTQANYSLPFSFQIKGDLDTTKLADALHSVINNNEALRIKIHLDKAGQYTQLVDDKIDFKLDYVELLNSDTDKIKSTINQYFLTKAAILYTSLVKFQLIKLDNQAHIFTFSLHHIIADGISGVLFTEQLAKAWNNPNSSILTNQPQINQYFQTLSNNTFFQIDALSAQKSYWLNYLSDAKYAAIPADFAYTDSTEIKHEEQLLVIDNNLTAQINQFAQRHHVSAFNVFYAVYNILISRYSAESDLCTTFQSHGRQNLKDASNSIGLYSCALILREHVSDNITIHDLLANLRNNIYQCIQNQRYPYHYVIKDTAIHPKYAINWYPKHHDPIMNGLEVTGVSYVAWQSDFDLNLHCNLVGNEIHLEPHFNPNTFSPNRIQVMLKQFENLLKQVISNPDKKLIDYALISDCYDHVLPDPALKLTSNVKKRIFDDFIANKQLQPDSPAIIYKNSMWTYGKTEQISHKLAQLILSKGLPEKAKIAILSARCPMLVMSMLAISRAGAAFAVLDASYPESRLQDYLEIINPDLLLVCGEHDVLSTLNHNLSHKLLVLPELLSMEDKLFSELVASDNVDKANADDIAYYLFTSGTTGSPKCIATSHNPLAHFVDWQIKTFSLSNKDNFTLLSGVGHDPVMRDIFSSLSAGGCLLIPEQDAIFNPDKLYQWLHSVQATVCHVTPQMSKVIHGGYRQPLTLDNMKHVFTGGDVLQKSHILAINDFAPDAKVINFYGATETPQAMAYHQVSHILNNDTIPLGKGISDIQVLILNKNHLRVGVYEVGQIAIRTKYLSQGYINQAQDNDGSFIQDSFSKSKDTRIYLTGDYGYYNIDGNIFFRGRIDDQVKIRGYRVELNDINNHLKSLPEIEDAVTLAVDSSHQEKRLVAYIVNKKSVSLDINSLNTQLQHKLPSYMIPYYYVLIEKIPLLPNGKIDRKNLPTASQENTSFQALDYIAPENEIELAIVQAWEQILGVNNIGIADTFASLGGDSLSYVQASLALERITGKITDNWNALSIKDLAQVNDDAYLLVSVNTAIVVRAISIVLVVTGHFWFSTLKGATGVLLLISGYVFSDFQLKTIAHKKNVRPIFKSIINILIPTTLYLLFMSFYFKKFQPEILLQYSNFIDPRMGGGAAPWYIQVMLQIFILMVLVFSFKKIRDYAIKQPYHFGIVFLSTSALLAVAMPYLWNVDHLYNRVPHMKLWYFALGWFIFYSTEKYQKIFAGIACALLPLAIAESYSWLLTICSLMLLFLPKIKFIRPMHKLIYALAGASFFIYISHFQFRSILHKTGLVDYPQLDVIAGLAGGVLIWHLWSYFDSKIKRVKWRELF